MADSSGGAGSALAGATPWGAIGQSVLGLGQAIIGGIKAHRAQKQLEKLQTPTYTPSKSITDYYNTALSRYNINPYQSTEYQNATNQIGRNTASGLNNLQGRGGSVAGVSRLAAIGNDSAIKAGITAENEQNQRFGQLGTAANAKAGEDRLAFQYNKLAPYEKQYNLLAMKAGANAQTTNAGIQNIFGGLGGIQDYGLASKLYGSNNGGSNFSSYSSGTYSPSYQNARNYRIIR